MVWQQIAMECLSDYNELVIMGLEMENPSLYLSELCHRVWTITSHPCYKFYRLPNNPQTWFHSQSDTTDSFTEV